MARTLHTDTFTEPLAGATSARVDINAGDGNLTIDGLPAGEAALAEGALQYLDNQARPARTRTGRNGQAALALKGGRAGRPWFRFPWSACSGATDWQIHLNRAVATDLTAHSDGGNLRLDLAGMAVTRVAADTGGGNIDVVLPDGAADLSVSAKTGAGNVTVEVGGGLAGRNAVEAASGAGNVVAHLPPGLAARVHLSTGLGKAVVDPRLSQVDERTYETPGFESARDRVELTLKSGAGDVRVN